MFAIQWPQHSKPWLLLRASTCPSPTHVPAAYYPSLPFLTYKQMGCFFLYPQTTLYRTEATFPCPASSLSHTDNLFILHLFFSHKPQQCIFIKDRQLVHAPPLPSSQTPIVHLYGNLPISYLCPAPFLTRPHWCIFIKYRQIAQALPMLCPNPAPSVLTNPNSASYRQLMPHSALPLFSLPCPRSFINHRQLAYLVHAPVLPCPILPHNPQYSIKGNQMQLLIIFHGLFFYFGMSALQSETGGGISEVCWFNQNHDL